MWQYLTANTGLPSSLGAPGHSWLAAAHLPHMSLCPSDHHAAMMLP